MNSLNSWIWIVDSLYLTSMQHSHHPSTLWINTAYRAACKLSSSIKLCIQCIQVWILCVWGLRQILRVSEFKRSIYLWTLSWCSFFCNLVFYRLSSHIVCIRTPTQSRSTGEFEKLYLLQENVIKSTPIIKIIIIIIRNRVNLSSMFVFQWRLVTPDVIVCNTCVFYFS